MMHLSTQNRARQDAHMVPSNPLKNQFFPLTSCALVSLTHPGLFKLRPLVNTSKNSRSRLAAPQLGPRPTSVSPDKISPSACSESIIQRDDK